jgi:hypothetical protein
MCIYIDKKPKIWTLIGQCDSGKSQMIKYLIWEHRNIFKFGLVFSPTKCTGQYNYIANQNYVIDGYSQEIEDKILKPYVQDLRKKTAELQTKAREKNPNIKDADLPKLPPNFIILDDIVGAITGSQWLQNFITTHRHTNTSIFIAAQYLKTRAIPTCLRENSNYIISFGSGNSNTYKALYEIMGNGKGITDFEQFKKLLQDATSEPYRSLVYSNTKEHRGEYCTYRCPGDLKEFKLKYS